MEENQSIRKRPKKVWLVSGFYLFSAGYTLLSFFLINRGKVPLSEAEKAYFASLTALDYLFTITIGVINMSGAISLFLLRKVAYPLFVGAFALGLVFSGWHALTKGLLAAVGGARGVGALIGWGILVAVCIYTKRLINRGLLV